MLKNIDSFSKNVIIVFLGSSFANFLNLVYQLLIAHLLSPVDFSAFNSLLSIFMIVSAPLLTIIVSVVKYSAEFNAHNQIHKIKILLTGLFKKTMLPAAVTFIGFCLFSPLILDKLKIHSLYSGYILAALLAFSWISPIVVGAIQGLELFKKLASISIINGIVKIALTFLFIIWGFNIAGALGALLISSFIGAALMFYPLRNFFVFSRAELADCQTASGGVNFKEVFIYMLPVAVSSFCFSNLTGMDMILVKYFFTPQDSGAYSLAQMVGKIFLFLPGAISVAMFPRTSALNAKKTDTVSTLKQSLLYAAILCLIAGLTYNLFPALILKILTGKALPESILLGRLFSISMSFYALLFVLFSYLLSLKDLRFIKYLVFSTVAQVITIFLFHKTLVQVQLGICLNAALIFFITLSLTLKKKHQKS